MFIDPYMNCQNTHIINISKNYHYFATYGRAIIVKKNETMGVKMG